MNQEMARRMQLKEGITLRVEYDPAMWPEPRWVFYLDYGDHPPQTDIQATLPPSKTPDEIGEIILFGIHKFSLPCHADPDDQTRYKAWLTKGGK